MQPLFNEAARPRPPVPLSVMGARPRGRLERGLAPTRRRAGGRGWTQRTGRPPGKRWGGRRAGQRWGRRQPRQAARKPAVSLPPAPPGRVSGRCASGRPRRAARRPAEERQAEERPPSSPPPCCPRRRVGRARAGRVPPAAQRPQVGGRVSGVAGARRAGAAGVRRAAHGTPPLPAAAQAPELSRAPGQELPASPGVSERTFRRRACVKLCVNPRRPWARAGAGSRTRPRAPRRGGVHARWTGRRGCYRLFQFFGKRFWTL